MLLCQTPDKFTRQGRVSGWERVNWAYLPSLTLSLLDRLKPLQEVTIGTTKLQEVMSGMAKLQNDVGNESFGKSVCNGESKDYKLTPCTDVKTAILGHNFKVLPFNRANENSSL